MNNDASSSMNWFWMYIYCVLGCQQACSSGHDWGFTEGGGQHMGEPASLNFISKLSCGFQIYKMLYSELFKSTWFGKIAECWNGLVRKIDTVTDMYNVIYPDFIKCWHHALEEWKHHIQYARWKNGEVLGVLCILIDITFNRIILCLFCSSFLKSSQQSQGKTLALSSNYGCILCVHRKPHLFHVIMDLMLTFVILYFTDMIYLQTLKNHDIIFIWKSPQNHDFRFFFYFMWLNTFKDHCISRHCK